MTNRFAVSAVLSRPVVHIVRSAGRNSGYPLALRANSNLALPLSPSAPTTSLGDLPRSSSISRSCGCFRLLSTLALPWQHPHSICPKMLLLGKRPSAEVWACGFGSCTTGLP